MELVQSIRGRAFLGAIAAAVFTLTIALGAPPPQPNSESSSEPSSGSANYHGWRLVAPYLNDSLKTLQTRLNTHRDRTGTKTVRAAEATHQMVTHLEKCALENEKNAQPAQYEKCLQAATRGFADSVVTTLVPALTDFCPPAK